MEDTNILKVTIVHKNAIIELRRLGLGIWGPCGPLSSRDCFEKTFFASPEIMAELPRRAYLINQQRRQGSLLPDPLDFTFCFPVKDGAFHLIVREENRSLHFSVGCEHERKAVYVL